MYNFLDLFFGLIGLRTYTIRTFWILLVDIRLHFIPLFWLNFLTSMSLRLPKANYVSDSMLYTIQPASAMLFFLFQERLRARLVNYSLRF